MSVPVTTVALATALFLCSLTAGFLVAFAVVVMPGLKTLDVDELDSGALREARGKFETRWNRWNLIRTGLACASAALMTTLLIIL